MIDLANLNLNQVKSTQEKSANSINPELKNQEISDLFSLELASLLGGTPDSLKNENSLNLENSKDLPVMKSDELKPSFFDPEITNKVQEIFSNSDKALFEKVDSESKDVNNLLIKNSQENGEKNSHDLLKLILGEKEENSSQKVKNPLLNEKSISNTHDFLVEKKIVKNHKMPTEAYGIKTNNIKLKNIEDKNLTLDRNLMKSEDAKEKMNSDFLSSLQTKSDSNQFKMDSSLLQDFSGKNESNLKNIQEIKTMQFSDIKSSDVKEIMTQITDYISQAKASQEKEVNLKFNHEELGIVDITVRKMSGGSQENNLSLAIGTQSLDTKSFFTQHSKDLISHLNQAGINILDIKVEQNQSLAKNDFSFNERNQQSQNFQDRQFGSEQNQRRHEQNRREELWNLLREKEVA
jgi:hypothetical protein